MNRNDPAAPVAEEEEEEEEEAPVHADEEILSGEEEAESDEEESESDDDEDSDLDDDDDYDDESDDDGEVDVPLKVEYFNIHAGMAFDELRPLMRRFSVLSGLFNDPLPRFANSGSTAGVLRVYAEEDQEEGERRQKYVLLLYRYTGFAVSRGGGGEVEVRRSTKLHQLRFAVPVGGDAAEALRWAGPALGPLIYPANHAGPLQQLWSIWASDLRVPPRAARVHLLADVAILRRRHYTLPRMEQVCARLGWMSEEPWRGYHVAMELQLPEPVVPRRPCEDQGKGEEKEECPVCLEELESGLAKWPGCLQPHVFHGECLELSLKESDKCPVCRRRLLALIDG